MDTPSSSGLFQLCAVLERVAHLLAERDVAAALASAKEALASEDQAAIDAAAAALNAAVAALVEKDVGPVYHTVTFDFNFTGGPDPVVVQVLDGETVEPIEAPARSGYVFSFWGTRRSGGWGGF